jgi:Site-specific recombinases, DNA invertase Pin homologs
MRIWLYYRLSRDEDDELNSLTNQRKIIYNYAVQQGYEIVGESFDDNVSGMHFNREGIDKIYEAVETGGIDAVLVKDLSRLGRHRTQTALFIDYLRENNVRVLSATENIDTFNENDDLIIGFKGLVNDFYARDGSSVVEYICTTYIRYGKEHCTAHTIREDTLDRLLETELLSTKKLYQNNWRALEQLIERWIPKANLAEGQIKKLKERLKILDDEIDAILLERIRDRDNAERYGRVIEKRQAETDSIHTRIGELENLSDTIRKKQATIKKGHLHD